MSGTRKTRPPLVRAFDSTDTKVSYEERHDHRNGEPCELPSIADAREMYLHENPRYVRLHCNYDWTSHVSTCGCPVCTDQFGRKRKTKNRRRAGKMEARTAQKEYARA